MVGRSVMLQVCMATMKAVQISGTETVTPVVVAELPVVVLNNVIPEKDVLYLPSPVDIWKYKQKKQTKDQFPISPIHVLFYTHMYDSSYTCIHTRHVLHT